MTTRPLYEIAADIRRHWHAPWYGALPYIEAMEQISTIDGMFGMDQNDSIVLYFLSNAKTWRGDAARRIKAELRGMLK